jgi:hypothetical protein
MLLDINAQPNVVPDNLSAGLTGYGASNGNASDFIINVNVSAGLGIYTLNHKNRYSHFLRYT